MPPDILPQRDQPAIRGPEGRRVNRPSRVVQSLSQRHRLHRRVNHPGAEARSGFHDRRRPHRSRQAVQSTQPAAARPRQPPLPAGQLLQPLLVQIHPQFDAVRDGDDFQRQNIPWMTDNALGEAKANGKILQVSGRPQHDRMRGAIVRQRDRGFLWHHSDAIQNNLASPGSAPHGNNRLSHLPSPH